MSSAISLAMWDNDRRRYICPTCSYLPDRLYKACGHEGCIEAALDAAREQGRREERERCALVASEHSCKENWCECDCAGMAQDIAAAIRAPEGEPRGPIADEDGCCSTCGRGLEPCPGCRGVSGG